MIQNLNFGDVRSLMAGPPRTPDHAEQQWEVLLYLMRHPERETNGDIANMRMYVEGRASRISSECRTLEDWATLLVNQGLSLGAALYQSWCYTPRERYLSFEMADHQPARIEHYLEPPWDFKLLATLDRRTVDQQAIGAVLRSAIFDQLYLYARAQKWEERHRRLSKYPGNDEERASQRKVIEAQALRMHQLVWIMTRITYRTEANRHTHIEHITYPFQASDALGSATAPRSDYLRVVKNQIERRWYHLNTSAGQDASRYLYDTTLDTGQDTPDYGHLSGQMLLMSVLGDVWHVIRDDWMVSMARGLPPIEALDVHYVQHEALITKAIERFYNNKPGEEDLDLDIEW